MLELAPLILAAQIIIIDVALAGDNAVMIGLAASGLQGRQRRLAVTFGTVGAAVIRIALTALAALLLNITGLTFIGGLLLTWICWQMWKEINGPHAEKETAHPKSFMAAIAQIAVADVSMSLDNVLAVAGAAGRNIGVLVFGLGASVALTAFAATVIAGMMHRHAWLAYAGVASVAFIAARMIYSGAFEIIA